MTFRSVARLPIILMMIGWTSFILIGPTRSEINQSADNDIPPQHPSLLNGYAVRPPWKVAGVDYGVGYPSTIKLAEPSTISMIGVSADRRNHTLTVTGDDVTIDGYDFSLDGGWKISVTSGTNILITNSNFAIGVNSLPPIEITGNAKNVTVSNSIFDGKGNARVDSLVMYNASSNGIFQFRRNWLKNSGTDGVWFLGGSKLILRDNLFESIGLVPGGHADAIQFSQSNTTGSQIVFNTLLFGQDLAYEGHLAGEGIQVESQVNSVGIFQIEVGNNILISTRPKRVNSYLIALRGSPKGSGANILDDVNCHDNYVDRGWSYGFLYPNGWGSNYTISNNMDMVTGRKVNR
jgi:hypothetical protein